MRVEVRLVRFVEVKQAAIKRIAKAEAEDLCCRCLEALRPSKGRIIRHCHERCARTNYRRIDAGLETDESLVAQGLWMPQEKAGRQLSEPAEFVQG